MRQAAVGGEFRRASASETGMGLSGVHALRALCYAGNADPKLLGIEDGGCRLKLA